MKSITRFVALPAHDRRLVVLAAITQVGALGVLALFGLPTAVRLARWLGARAEIRADLPSLTWALAASAARVHGTCLTQALAALAMSAQASRNGRLVIGVRRPVNLSCGVAAGVPEFHAWTEIAAATLPLTCDHASFKPVMVWG